MLIYDCAQFVEAEVVRGDHSTKNTWVVFFFGKNYNEENESEQTSTVGKKKCTCFLNLSEQK